MCAWSSAIIGSPLPWIDGASIVLEITQSHETHRFKRGSRVAIPVEELLQYRTALLDMLDAWALPHLRSLDQDLTLDQLVFDSNGNRKGEHDFRHCSVPPRATGPSTSGLRQRCAHNLLERDPNYPTVFHSDIRGPTTMARRTRRAR
jgi:hypothetical protein